MGILVGTDRGHAHARDARRGDMVGMVQLGKGLGQGADENGQGIERQVVLHTVAALPKWAARGRLASGWRLGWSRASE